MDTKFVTGVVIGAVLISGGSFYAGTKYASGRSARGNFQLAGQQRGARLGGPNGGMGFVAGKIVAKDATSLTIELAPSATTTNGLATGSKIILLSNTTQVGKFSNGTSADLSIGEMVTVNGTTNSDGSISAQMVQIRPEGMGGFGGGRIRAGQ